VQSRIWDDKIIDDEALNSILSELAYDLDFYEPNEELRKESSNYYGNDYLHTLIQESINKIVLYTKTGNEKNGYTG
jgi:hypothetical protein